MKRCEHSDNPLILLARSSVPSRKTRTREILASALILAALVCPEARGEADIPEPVRAAMASIVRLHMPEGTSSGFLLPDGMIGTILHGIEGDDKKLVMKLVVFFSEAAVLVLHPTAHSNRFLDLALLKVDPHVVPAWLPWPALRAAIAAMDPVEPAGLDAQMSHAELIGALTQTGQ